MFPIIVTFTFSLILWPFWLFGTQMGFFGSQGKVKKMFLGTTHVVEQLLFSMFPSFLTFYFDLISGLFLTFWVPNGLFLGHGYGSKTVFGSPHIYQ